MSRRNMRNDVFGSSFPSLPEPEGPGLGFKLWFAFCALVGLAVTGVLIWAVIELVRWVTTK